MADETIVADTWIYSTLTGDSALMGEVTGVHSTSRPRDSDLPAVIFDWIAGSDITYINGIRVWHSGVWVVKAVAATTSWADLQAAAERIDVLLHRQSGTAAGGTVFTATREAPHRQAYSDEGVSYRELGGRFRIEVQA